LLIGQSLGALVAIYVAAKAPDLTRAALIAEPPLYWPESGMRDHDCEAMAGLHNAGRPVAQLVEAGTPPPRAEALARLDPGTMEMLVDGSAS
jgi:pimeloyl-ACP methyl ester carboxylesterase